MKNAHFTQLSFRLSESHQSYEQLSFENQRTNDILETILSDHAKLNRDFNALKKENMDMATEIKRLQKLEFEWNNLVGVVSVLGAEVKENVPCGILQKSNRSSESGIEELISINQKNLDIEKRCAELQKDLVVERDEKQVLKRNLDLAEAALLLNQSPTGNILQYLYQQDLNLSQNREKIFRLEKEFVNMKPAAAGSIPIVKEGLDITKESFDSNPVSNEIHQFEGLCPVSPAKNLMRIKKELVTKSSKRLNRL